jgi:hypothetical protein
MDGGVFWRYLRDKWDFELEKNIPLKMPFLCENQAASKGL